MQIPIYIDGSREGTLTIQRQGPVTVMEADMRDVGRVVRLSVYGEKCGYLGVPEPEGGRLRLVRRFSPLDMTRFPQSPRYAAEKPMDRKTAAPAPQKPAEEQPVRRHVLWMGGKPYYF